MYTHDQCTSRIEQRRRRVFEKMNVESAVPLAALRSTVDAFTKPARRGRLHVTAEQPGKQLAPPARYAPALPFESPSEQPQLAIS